MDVDEGIATIRLHRPPANALNIELIEAIREAMETCARDGAIQGVLLTGSGDTFCGGIDIREVPQYGPEQMHRMIMGINRLCLSTYGLLKPMVIAVNGHAIGGGLVIALMGDLRFVADGDGQLGLGEVKAGIPFPACPLQIMNAEMRPEVRRRMALTGESIDADTALAWGLFDEKVEASRLVDRAGEQLRKLTAHPPASYRVIKNQMRVATIVRMADIIEREADPMLQQWMTR